MPVGVDIYAHLFNKIRHFLVRWGLVPGVSYGHWYSTE
jgi:hypothetical protein